ncbi:MAG: electron transfer flavoprotein subunit beta [marine bacterium B5-7]|nr:MAG: electron transfer flavoprotein subunit beta [marine bacterium B5-7]
MKILVAVKRVLDHKLRVRVKTDQSDVDLANLKLAMNPFDEIAVEEALRLKEKGIASEVIVVSIGPGHTQETLRAALAMGADRAELIETDQSWEPLNIAKILKHLVDQEKPQLVFLGKQSIDGDNNQTGQMLAALLDWPQATFASACTLENEHLTVTREVDGGLQTLRCTLPAVLTTDLRLNEPRFASLPNIMKAKSKPFQTTPLESLNLPLKTHNKLQQVALPPTRAAGILVDNVDTLIEKLKAHL